MIAVVLMLLSLIFILAALGVSHGSDMNEPMDRQTAYAFMSAALTSVTICFMAAIYNEYSLDSDKEQDSELVCDSPKSSGHFQSPPVQIGEQPYQSTMHPYSASNRLR